MSAAEVMAPLAPRHAAALAAGSGARRAGRSAQRFFGGRLPEHEGPLTLALAINRSLGDLLASSPSCWCSAKTSAARAACTA